MSPRRHNLYFRGLFTLGDNPETFTVIMVGLRIPNIWSSNTLRINLVALAAVAVFFRLWGLDHLPGVNGDEAWYGAKSLELLQGKSTSWLTPTNNVLNPLYFAPTLALHSVAGPSLALLRVTAVLSGLAALALNFFFCRRVFDTRTATVSTAILALLPINIAYSRFGWDPSQTLLVSVLVLYFGLAAMRSSRPRPWLLAGAVAYGLAMLVHPANIFLGPLLVVPALMQSKDQVWRAIDPRGPVRCWAPAYGVALAAATFVVMFGSHWIQRVGERFMQPSDTFVFAKHFVRLFSGVTVYDFISGAYAPGYETAPGAAWRVLYDLGGFILAGLLATGLTWRLWRRRDRLELGLAAGYGVCLLAFFLVGGSAAIAPHYERYAICLIAPAVLLATRALLSGWETWPRAMPLALSAIGWVALAGFYVNYFQFIEETGGQSHRAFRTGSVEPKLLALNSILARRDAGRDTWIVTHESWNYRPLKYLAMRKANLSVKRWDEAVEDPALSQALQENRVWFVEFADGEQLNDVRRFLARRNRKFVERQITGYGGRPVLAVLGTVSGP